MVLCPAPQSKEMVTAVLGTVDCHIREMVHHSYMELVGPNTWFAQALTAILTIYIALVGYQLILGRGGLRLTELPMSALKIGLVFAFLTSWAAYQTVVFNLLFDGPSQLLETLLRPMAAQGGGFNGNVMGGVQGAFNTMSAAAEAYGGMANPAANILQGGPMLGSGLLWMTSIAMLLTTLGLIVAAKIVLAFLLAIGPVFVGLALFNVTRGLFDGWLRATLSFSLIPMAVSVFGAVMMLILQPFLAMLKKLAHPMNGGPPEFDMSVVITIGLIVAVFVIVMMMAMGAVTSIARGFRRDPAPAPERGRSREAPADVSPMAVQGRADAIAARIAQSDRFAPPLPAATSYREIGGGGGRRGAEVAESMWTPPPSHERLGQAYTRAPRPQVSTTEES
jgi:type IV secretion system protein VirB6